jgi:GntR family transcriptional regulator
VLLKVDATSDVPLFAQIAASVRADAAAGRLRAGDRLPPAREIAAVVGVNLHTVLRAYADLRDEGLLDLRRGRGAVLTDAAARLSDVRDEVAALVRTARDAGLSADALASLVKETWNAE